MLRVPLLLALLCTLPLSATAAEGPRIAVLEFVSGGGGAEFEALGKGLQSMVTTDLSQVPSLRLVERARLQEIQSELRLGRSGLVDGKTAARIGKLAGATHLLTGSFAVVGPKMRLDSRLFSVERGDVLAAEKIEGDKDAFFDLQKALVQKLIESVGVKLAPKERVAVGRVHTTDFEAFRRFSEGVQLFDEKKYDEALVALRDAGSRDRDFKLAAVTLDEYERVITQLRAKADEIQAAQAQVEQMKADQGVKAHGDVMQRLFAMTQGARGPASEERLVALHMLALYYGYGDGYGHHEKLRRVQDEFSLQRTSDTLWKSYFADASALPPGQAPVLPLVVTVEASGKGLSDPAKLAEDLKETTGWLRDLYVGGFKRRFAEIATNLNHVGELAQRMHLDQHGACALRDTLLRLAERLEPPPDFKTGWQRDTAVCLRAAGEYARSTAILSAVGAAEKEPWRIKATADEIGRNRDMEKLLQRARRKQLVAEFLTIGERVWSGSPFQETAEGLGADRPTPRDLHRLNYARRVQEGAYVLLGDAPVWVVRGGEGYRDDPVVTGPRTDPLRARELRYYREGDGAEALAIVDGVPRRELQARFEVALQPAEDYWPPQLRPDKAATSAKDLRLAPRRPEVAVAFALRDVQADPRPTRGLELVIAEDALRLVELTQADPRKAPTLKVLQERRVDLRGARTLEVSARVSGSGAELKVNGQSASFPLPGGERGGFYGIHLRGPGYAAVRGVAFK